MGVSAQPLSPTERVISALADHGCNPRQRGQSWSARCPAHDDRNPSLSVSDGHTGNALVYCHAGCTVAEVATALGLRMVDLFPPRQRNEVIPMGGIKAVYTYHDAEGRVAYQVVRKWPKTFRQRRPDGKDGWINNVDGVEKIPYQLPQVLRAKAQGKTIWVCEGEKDAENAQWLGVVGTCNSGGAGKWNEHCTAALEGADRVVVVADRDEVGYAHARQVARALEGKVKRLFVAEATKGKDLSEHQANGGTAEDMHILWDSLNPSDWLDGAVEVVEQANPLLGLLIDWPTFWSVDRAEEAWLAYPLLPEGRQIALFAPAKTGKSLLALDVAAAVATGRPVLGGQSAPRRHVLYLDYEMTEADLQERLFDLGYTPEDDLSWLHYALLPSLPPLDTLDGAKACCELAELVEADLVVVDTLGRAVQGDENDADTLRAFARHTGLALKAAGRTVLRTDHAGKDVEKGQRGTSAKNDDVDVVWRLVRMEGALSLKRTHSRVQWVPDQLILRIEEDPLRHVITDEGYPAGTAECAAKLDALGLPVEVSTRQAQAALKAAGFGSRRQVVVAAVKARKRSGTTRGTTLSDPPGTPDRNQTPETQPDQAWDQDRTTGNHAPSPFGPGWWSPLGDHPGQDRPGIDPDEPEELF